MFIPMVLGGSSQLVSLNRFWRTIYAIWEGVPTNWSFGEKNINTMVMKTTYPSHGMILQVERDIHLQNKQK